MPAAISADLRQRIVDAYREGEGSFKKLAKRFKVDPNTVNNLVQLERRTGSLEPKHGQGGNNAKILPSHHSLIREMITDKPDDSHAQRCAEFEARTGIVVSESAMCATVKHKLGYTRKKSRRNTPSTTTRPSSAGRPSSASASAASTPDA